MWLQVFCCFLLAGVYCPEVPHHHHRPVFNRTHYEEVDEGHLDDEDWNEDQDDHFDLESFYLNYYKAAADLLSVSEGSIMSMDDYGDDDDDVRYGRFMNSFRPSELLTQAVRIVNSFGLQAVRTFQQPVLGGVSPGTSVVFEGALNPVKFVESVVKPKEVGRQLLQGVEPCKRGAGICTAATYCYSKGGTKIGSCRNCAGCSICCKFEQPCQSQTDAYISYFTSPGYPKTQRRSTSCSLNVQLKPEVCQVRLDFLDFEMAAPDNCACRPDDSMEIINPHQQGGVIGPDNNRVCGMNKNKHMYLDVDPDTLLILKATASGVQPIPLATNTDLSGDTAFRWNVRVTQIPCDEVRLEKEVDIGDGIGVSSLTVNTPIPKFYKNLRAPSGCLQYYMKGKGTFESYSFDGDSQMLTNTDYAVCIQGKTNTCGMTLRARHFSIPAAPTHECTSGKYTVNNNSKAYGSASLCCDIGQGTGNDRNYIAVPAVDLPSPNAYRELFCGQNLGPSNSVTSKTKGPLFVRVRTGSVCHKRRKTGSNLGYWTGFRIDYDINTGTC